MKNHIKRIILLQILNYGLVCAIIIPPVAPLIDKAVNSVSLPPKSSTPPLANTTLQTEPEEQQSKVAKTTPPKEVLKELPKSTVKQAKTITPKQPKVVKTAKVLPKTIAPKIVPPPIEPKITAAPKVVVPAAKIAQSTIATEKTVIKTDQPTLATLSIRRVMIENTSKYPATLNGWVIDYSDAKNQKHELVHTLTKAHVLKPKSKATGGIIAKIKEIPVSVSVGSSIHGISALKINGGTVSTTYKNVAWMPGQLTDTLYVTSGNGTSWQLDKKAMDKNYAVLSGKSSVSDMNDQSDTQRITPTTQAVTTAMLQNKNVKKNKKKSKSTQAVA